MSQERNEAPCLNIQREFKLEGRALRLCGSGADERVIAYRASISLKELNEAYNWRQLVAITKMRVRRELNRTLAAHLLEINRQA